MPPKTVEWGRVDSLDGIRTQSAVEVRILSVLSSGGRKSPDSSRDWSRVAARGGRSRGVRRSQ